MSVCLVTLASGTFFIASAQEEITQKDILEYKIRELEREKQERLATRTEAAQAKPDLNSLIDRYEKFLEGCAVKKYDRCPDVMYTLGSLYYDQAKELANKNKTEPDYRKSLNMYWQVAIEYPKFEKLPEAYNEMGLVYYRADHLDSANMVFERLVYQFPNSPRASKAHSYLGNIAYVGNDFNKAYRHFTKVKKNEVDITMWEMVHYSMGTCAYMLGDFDKSVEYFRGYVEEYDKGTYKNKELRNMALDYIRAITEQKKK
jgi:TolA-binding protein